MSSRTLEVPRTLVTPEQPASAGLPIRLAASVVDLVVVGTVAVVAGLGAHMVISLLPAGVQQAENWGLGALAGIVATGYFVYFWGVEGATPGKKLLGLRVTRLESGKTRESIGLGRAFLRLVAITAGNILFVDLLVAFLHRDRRPLHDLVADSIVVESRA